MIQSLGTLCRYAVVAGFAATAAAQTAGNLPLKTGAYIERRYACKDAPFAALRTWDGKGLGGAHDSKCTTHVLAQQGRSYSVDTVCTAAGDGSPVPPSHERANIVVTGPESFTFTSAVQPQVSKPTVFRWCGATP